MKNSRIPDFKSYEEEAHFWDTHDFTEFRDETTPVTVRSTLNYSANVQVRFTPEDNRRLETYAQEEGMKKSTLIRMVMKKWLHDKSA